MRISTYQVWHQPVRGLMTPLTGKACPAAVWYPSGTPHSLTLSLNMLRPFFSENTCKGHKPSQQHAQVQQCAGCAASHSH